MDKRRCPVLFLLAVLLGTAACGSDNNAGSGSGSLPIPVQSWVLVEGGPTVPGLHSQGLARLPRISPNDFAFTSRFTIDRVTDGKVVRLGPAFNQELLDVGFDHLGDPDAYGPLVFGGLEDNSAPVVAPYHRGFVVFDSETLSIVGWANDPGSANRPGDGDCPWVAVSPDGEWVVTGQWAPMLSLIVYRAMELVSAHTVHQVGEIPIEPSISDIQGCDFDGPQVLLCASDNADAGRLIYSITLSGPLQGETLPRLTGHVEPLFPAPVPEKVCDNPEEVEGVDVDGDTLRVLVLGSCAIDSYLYRYERCKGECPQERGRDAEQAFQEMNRP